MAAAKTTRNLVNPLTIGGPNLTLTAGKRVATFTSSLDIKPGCTIGLYISTYDYPQNTWWVTSRYFYTVEGGTGTEYVLDQKADVGGTFLGDTSQGGSPSGFYWTVSDQSSSRARGQATPSPQVGYPLGAGPFSGALVPDATHFIYWSPVDDTGAPDYYTYIDTVQPERGVHPYTLDKAIGSFKTPPRPSGNDVATRMIADFNTRVKELEGAIRAGRPSGSKSQDYRLADLVARFYALEQWTNSAGHFGTPPAPGSNATYAESDFIVNGDPA